MRGKANHARPQQSTSYSSFHAPRIMALVIFATAVAVVALGYSREGRATSGDIPPTTPAGIFSVSTPLQADASVPSDPQPPSPTSTPDVPLPIGIVAGHLGNDSGAICEETNLQEVHINTAVANRVKWTLVAMGYETDLLEEYDPRLEGYRARVLVSIHADSCLYPEASGFKVARVEDSAVPELEDLLVECLTENYHARTGLEFHGGSITSDMTLYHIFYDIDPQTPAAIIELGFMLADREILTARQDLVAQGVVDGILCFLEGVPE